MTRYRIYPADHLATAAQTDLLAWMAAERSGLLMQLVDLDERTLCQQAVTRWLDRERPSGACGVLGCVLRPVG